MQSRMESGEPIHEQPGAAYRGYEGQQQEYVPPYTPPYEQSSSRPTYDDNLTEAIAQRVVQLLNQNPGAKIGGRGRDRASASQRLALAIVSLVLLVPIAGVLVGVLHGIGLIGFIVACAAVLFVNLIFR